MPRCASAATRCSLMAGLLCPTPTGWPFSRARGDEPRNRMLAGYVAEGRRRSGRVQWQMTGQRPGAGGRRRPPVPGRQGLSHRPGRRQGRRWPRSRPPRSQGRRLRPGRPRRRRRQPVRRLRCLHDRCRQPGKRQPVRPQPGGRRPVRRRPGAPGPSWRPSRSRTSSLPPRPGSPGAGWPQSRPLPTTCRPPPALLPTIRRHAPGPHCERRRRVCERGTPEPDPSLVTSPLSASTPRPRWRRSSALSWPSRRSSALA